MKAITYARYGSPDVLQLRDVPRPAPKDDELLIRVRATEATKADCELRSFRFAVKWFWLPLRIALGIRRPRRQILGGYFAGEIAAVGRNVTTFAVGDEVFGGSGLRFGAYGEYLTLPTSATLTVKPRTMSFAEAAAVPLGGLNALHFMRLARIGSGDRVLVNGAGGSIGTHAVQIARAMGAHVTAVDGPVKEPLLRRLGVDAFIDYTTTDFTATGQTWDVLFDMVPGSSYSKGLGVLTPTGRYLCGNPRLSVMLRSLLTSWFTRRTASFAFAGETRQELETLRTMIDAGQIQPIVDRVLPMTRAADAHRLVETEQRVGAIVLAIGDDDVEADEPHPAARSR